MKLQIRLSIIVIAILIAVVAGISITLLLLSSNMATTLSQESMTRLASQQASYWEGQLATYLSKAQTVASIMGEYETLAAGERRDYYNRILYAALAGDPSLVIIYSIWKPNVLDNMDAQFAGQPGYTASGQYAMNYSRESGSIEYRASRDVDAAMAQMNGPNAKRTYVEDPAPRQLNGKDIYAFRVRSPVINTETGEVVGMVGLIIDISSMQGVISETIKNNNDISAMSLYSNNGFIMGSYEKERVGKVLSEADASLYQDVTGEANNAVLGGTPFRTKQYSSVLKTELELAIFPFELGDSGTSWSIMIGTSEDEILFEVREMTWIAVIVSAITALAVAVIIYFVAGRIAKPIVNVAATLKDISEGEGDLTKEIVIKSRDEIGDLSHFFNRTLQKIRELVVTIKKQSTILFDIGNELASSMTETAAAINEITANIQSIKGRVINQSASVTETNATMEQITINIGKLNGHVENQTASVAQSSSAIEQMLANIQSVTSTLVKNAGNVRELLEASDVGRNGLQEVSTDIQEIARESEGLLEINAVMENIASQTNLLSMNAAIEAAHAGEAGKGFAVVADEIRKLAENSGEQSKTISAVLKKIKDSIDKITKSTDEVLNKFESIDSQIRTVSDQEENIRNAMEEQGTGSQQILEAIGQLNNITQMVKGGSTEMLEGSQEVIQEGKNLEMATQEITNGMNEMATGADQINTAVHDVQNISSQNKDAIQVLVQEVSKFKIE